MTRQGKRPKPGDVLELQVPGGLAYLHFIGRHPDYGDSVMVSPRIYSTPMTPGPQLFEGGYVAFYPVTVAVKEDFVRVTGSLSVGEVPKRLRRRGVRAGRRPGVWIIEDESGEVVRDRLSAEELRLPIASIWNHEMLIHQIVEGWRPELEGADS